MRSFGYQYVPGASFLLTSFHVPSADHLPVETVEPGNDRSLEGWTACPVRRVSLMHVMSLARVSCLVCMSCRSRRLTPAAELPEARRGVPQVGGVQEEGEGGRAVLRRGARLRVRPADDAGECVECAWAVVQLLVAIQSPVA